MSSEVAKPAAAALAKAAGYAEQALARSSRAAYRADWSDFAAWCHRHGEAALPAAPNTVAAYLADMAAVLRPATLRRRLVSIGQAHKVHGHEWVSGHPAIRATLRGILNRHGTPQRKAAALGTAEMKRLLGM